MTAAAAEARQIRGRVPGLFLEIHDDFHDDLNVIRGYALNCEWDEPIGSTWPGLVTLQQHPEAKETYERVLARLPATGSTTWRDAADNADFWGRELLGLFAFLPQGGRDKVHAHVRSGSWVAVCYLSSPPPGTPDGVTFFRHRETGLCSAHDVDDVTLSMLRGDGPDRDMWEPIATVQAKPNRMVIFDGIYFHAATDGYGNGPLDGRLTQEFGIDFD